jgi:sugar lactone lactonase YvrE
MRFILVLAVALTVLSEWSAQTQSDIQPVNDPPNPYTTVEGWAKMPDGRTWGSTSAVDIDPGGKSIWVAERCGANSCVNSNLPVVLKFDETGKLVKSFGAGIFAFPHGIHVDRQGNVWVTDGVPPGAASQASSGKSHFVIKFSPEGKVLLTLGKPGVAGDGPDTFNQPSDVITAPNGDIFVADGHGGNTNARIVKFDKNGKFIKTWGKKGSAPGEFDTPHALAMDSKGRLLVGDRNNNRIQIFDQDGKFLAEWKQFSRPSGLYIDKNDVLYVADSESNKARHPGWKRGIRIGSVKDGKVWSFIPDPESNPDTAATSAAEGVAADAKGNVYGAEVGPRALKRYVKK